MAVHPRLTRERSADSHRGADEIAERRDPGAGTSCRWHRQELVGSARSIPRVIRVAPCRVYLVVEHCGSFRVKLGFERLRHLVPGQVTSKRAEDWVWRKGVLLTTFTPPEEHEWRLRLGDDGRSPRIRPVPSFVNEGGNRRRDRGAVSLERADRLRAQSRARRAGFCVARKGPLSSG